MRPLFARCAAAWYMRQGTAAVVVVRGACRHGSTTTPTTSAPTAVQSNPTIPLGKGSPIVHSHPRSRPRPLRSSASSSSSAPSVLSHCRLLARILRGGDEDAVKARRVRGVVRQLEAHHVDWLARDFVSAPPAQVGRAALEALALSVAYLSRQRSGSRSSSFADASDDAEWVGSTPFFSPELSDALALCFQHAAHDRAATVADDLALLDCTVRLELADGDTLGYLVGRVVSRSACAGRSPEALVEVLRLVSLAVKRCKLTTTPPMEHVLAPLPSAQLSARDALQVLSSLLRLKHAVWAIDVGEAVSRRSVPQVRRYTARDVIYGLEAVALLDSCSEVYAAAVLDRCAELAPSLTAPQLGDVAKYVALLNPTRRSGNTVALACENELSRTLPAMVERAEQLIGTFTIRDARCVLRCLSEHRVRHTMVFSRLTPLISE